MSVAIVSDAGKEKYPFLGESVVLLRSESGFGKVKGEKVKGYFVSWDKLSSMQKIEMARKASAINGISVKQIVKHFEFTGHVFMLENLVREVRE